METPGSGEPQSRIGGQIDYFGLTDWWLNTFSDDERDHIQRTFQPLGGTGDSLTSGTISYTSRTAVALLGALAGWFTKEETRSIGHRFLDKAAALAVPGSPVLDIHFLYQQMIETYYRDRDQAAYLVKAVEACRKQISLAPEAAKAFFAEYPDSPLPGHKGFEQLAIILEKQGKFVDAIELCQLAQTQGWAGNWEKRVARLEKKHEKV